MTTATQHFSRSLLGSALISLSAAIMLPAIATAPMPPNLVKARLNGKPIDVLYMTRSGDQVLVRCYPGQQPNVAVSKKADGTMEGLLTCGS
jgi:hypothetical protein